MKPEAIRGNQRQSEAISCLSYRGHQRPSVMQSQAAPQVQLRCNQTQSDAIRRNQTQSARPEHCVSVCFVFWAGHKWACVLCFCVLSRHTTGNGPVFCVFVFWQTPLKTQHGGKRHTTEGATEKLGFLVNSETRHTEGASNQIKSLSLLDSAKGVVLLGLSGGVEFVSVCSVYALCTCVRPVYALRRSGVLGVE